MKLQACSNWYFKLASYIIRLSINVHMSLFYQFKVTRFTNFYKTASYDTRTSYYSHHNTVQPEQSESSKRIGI